MKEIKKYCVVKQTLHLDIDELDYDLYDQLDVDMDNDETLTFIHHDYLMDEKRFINDFPTDNNIISVSALEEQIKKIKESGANYVSILHHADHRAYEFDAFNIRKGDDIDIDFFKAKYNRNRKAIIDEKKTYLENELKKLENLDV